MFDQGTSHRSRISDDFWLPSHTSSSTTTSWRLEALKIAHQVARPFLCNECGKCFKTNRNLKIHSKLHQENVTPSSKEKPTSSETRKIDSLNKGGECQACHKMFTTKRFLRHHIETVHKGLKPLMCNFCG